MIVGLIMVLSGLVLLYLAVIDRDLKEVADDFLKGAVVKRSF